MCEEQNGKDSVDISQEVDNLWGTIKEPIEKIVELVKYFAEQITTMIQPLLDLWLPIIEVVKVKHPKIYHLAVHGKTERIRKKNQKRLFEIIFGKKGGGLYGKRLVGQSK